MLRNAICPRCCNITSGLIISYWGQHSTCQHQQSESKELDRWSKKQKLEEMESKEPGKHSQFHATLMQRYKQTVKRKTGIVKLLCHVI